MFEQNLFEEILRAWEADQNSHPYQRRQMPPPDIRDVRALVETAFLASLRHEEGRPLTFALTLLPKNTAMMARGRISQILRFDKRLNLNVESVTKLALAFDPKVTSLLVSPLDDQTNGHEIWGAVMYIPPANIFTIDDPGTLMDLFRPPDNVTVTAVSAGSLVISRGDAQIGRLASGTFTRAALSPFNDNGMRMYISELVSAESLYAQRYFPDDDPGRAESLTNWYIARYMQTLEYLLGEASSRGHGGTVILIPRKEVEGFSKNIIKTYSFEADGISVWLKQWLMEFVESEQLPNLEAHNFMFKLTLPHRLGILAQLTCIDGALVLSSNLEVIAFGAKLKASPWKGKVLIWPPEYDHLGDLFDTSTLGTRHHSVIDYVGECPGSLGFVISQDGPIRGFVRNDEDTIYCWPDCSASKFI
jgi:hypothetical protein